jgi:2-oxoglutarate ferredoxin oxidoreductase subunit beta
VDNPYKTNVAPVWCAGCGDFGVLTSIYQVLNTKAIPPERVAIVSGIGCSSRLPAYVNAYGFHSVHGRVLPVATGIKTAKPELEVIGVGGDGDAYSIGGGHIVHAARRNVDMCYIVMDNEVYGLTKGQVSATAPRESVKGTTPFGVLEDPLNPVAMAIAYGVSFVGRGYSGKPRELTALILSAMDHKGFALVEVLSPCTTFNNTYKDISSRICFLDASYDPSDKLAAMKTAFEPNNIPLGIIYRQERPTFEDLNSETRSRALAKAGPGELERLMDTFK